MRAAVHAAMQDGSMPDPVAHLQALVRLATISRLPVTDTEWAPYDDFIDPLPELYPATHTTPTREMVKGHSMIYRWAGRTNGRTDGRPFSWPTTTWCPRRTRAGRIRIYLSFGHDEETENSGARAIVDLLENRGIRPSLVTEKGILSLTPTVERQGGHASTPPKLSATARLATAIVRLNDRPFRAGSSPTSLEMIRTLGAHATRPLRWIFTDLWLTKPLLPALFGRLGPETNAMVRATIEAIYPGTIVAPYVMMAASDSRYLTGPMNGCTSRGYCGEWSSTLGWSPSSDSTV
jgi:carboxypeptidase PM20D1